MISEQQMVVGDKYYIPFWILLEYLDHAPLDPFIQAEIINIKEMNSTKSDGMHKILCCDIDCLSQQDKQYRFKVDNLPCEYLIAPKDLSDWADKISKWFKKFPENIKQ